MQLKALQIPKQNEPKLKARMEEAGAVTARAIQNLMSPFIKEVEKPLQTVLKRLCCCFWVITQTLVLTVLLLTLGAIRKSLHLMRLNRWWDHMGHSKGVMGWHWGFLDGSVREMIEGYHSQLEPDSLLRSAKLGAGKANLIHLGCVSVSLHPFSWEAPTILRGSFGLTETVSDLEAFCFIFILRFWVL